MGFHRMVDLARSPAETAKDLATGICCPPSPNAAAPVYPYGLCITLDQDTLDKLELDGDCNVGDMIHLVAFAEVTSCNKTKMRKADGTEEECCRIELQITHLAVEDEDQEAAQPRRPVPRDRRIKQRYAADEDDAGAEAAERDDED